MLQHFDTLQNYVLERLESEWETVGSLISQGKISAEYINYLFVNSPNHCRISLNISSDKIKVPQSMLISKTSGESSSQAQAFLATGWLVSQTQENYWAPASGRSGSYDFAGYIDGISWRFDGNFQRKTARLPIGGLPSRYAPFEIMDLITYPMKFADIQLQKTLRARGEMFWKCRKRNYVATTQDQKMESRAHLTQGS